MFCCDEWQKREREIETRNKIQQQKNKIKLTFLI
jgi:hypothetical protein